MKKISQVAALLILSASFGVPLLASAQFDYTCNPTCSQGMFCNSDKKCVSIDSTLTQQPPGGSGAINPKYLQDYKTSIIWVINFILLPILVAIAFIVFLWGVYKYFILGADSDTERATGRQFALWGIIGFVVIFSVWSLVNLVSVTL